MGDSLPSDAGPGALLRKYSQEKSARQWRGSFEQYLDIAVVQPSVARLSHARIYDAIMAAGTTTQDEHVSYHFFDNELFGMEKPIRQLVDYFRASAQGLEVRKRILLMMGPVSAGKSTAAILLKRGLEAYTRTDAGAVYGIVGCPMHEEPLHLIPQDMRDIMRDQYKLYIEGDLCPRCKLRLDTEYNGDYSKFQVERMEFSEKDRLGIGTYAPSSEKDSDISDLVGSIDFATIAEYGAESDPRAYRFDGEFNVANRGMIELVEMLKVPQQMLFSLLTLSQEQAIKAGRFPMIYADEVIVAHSNEAEYRSFAGDRKSEALQDRVILVRVPYNLRVHDEKRIYEKLLNQRTSVHAHIAPDTLTVASTFAVLTRLVPPKKADVTLMKKLQLYDGQDVAGMTAKDVKELEDENPTEGMSGISPRYILNRLAQAVTQDSVQCLGPLDALRTIRDGLEQHTGLTEADKTRYKDMLGTVRADYDDRAQKAVQRAFVYSYEDTAMALFNNYIDHVEAYCTKTKITDPLTGEEVEADEKLMKSIEQEVGVSDTTRKSFREEILMRISALARKGKKLDYTSHSRLKEAIEKKLFADLKDSVKVTTSAAHPDPDQLKRVNAVVDRLVKEDGYCTVCANELLRYVGHLLSR